jgi:hypothetical protein
MRHEENYCIWSGSSIGGCPLEEASEQERIPSIIGSIVWCYPTSRVFIIDLCFSIWFHISCVVIVFRYLWIYCDILYSGIVLKYHGALHRYIQTEMDFLDISSLGMAYPYVVKIEQNLKQKTRQFGPGNPSQQNPGKGSPNPQNKGQSKDEQY